MREHKRMVTVGRYAAVLLALVSVVILAGCGGSSSAGGGGSTSLTLVAYSTPEAAYDALIPQFRKTHAGKGVEFKTSYDSSGEQSRAVESGLPADVVEFSLEPDMTRLVDAGLVDPDWNKDEYDGMVTDSVVVIAVRKGNPLGIEDWSDLTKPGVEVITPNPFTSGGARWNVMAGYGAQLEQGKSRGIVKCCGSDLMITRRPSPRCLPQALRFRILLQPSPTPPSEHRLASSTSPLRPPST